MERYISSQSIHCGHRIRSWVFDNVPSRAEVSIECRILATRTSLPIRQPPPTCGLFSTIVSAGNSTTQSFSKSRWLIGYHDMLVITQPRRLHDLRMSWLHRAGKRHLQRLTQRTRKHFTRPFHHFTIYSNTYTKYAVHGGQLCILEFISSKGPERMCSTMQSL